MNKDILIDLKDISKSFGEMKVIENIMMVLI